MSAAEATAMLETVLAARNAGQLIVSTGDLGARIAQWVQLESLDAGPTEKAAPSLSRSAEDAPEALRDETEQQVARIWEAALGIEAIGSSDSFADLGGHSLLAIRVVAELRKAFQIDLGVRALFDAPTVAELSRHIRAQIAAEVDSLTEEQAQSLASVQ